MILIFTLFYWNSFTKGFDVVHYKLASMLSSDDNSNNIFSGEELDDISLINHDQLLDKRIETKTRLSHVWSQCIDSPRPMIVGSCYLLVVSSVAITLMAMSGQFEPYKNPNCN